MTVLRSFLFYGVIIASVISFISLFDQGLAMTISGFLGGGLLILAMVFSGSLNSGDRMRANYSRENYKERNERFKMTEACLKLGLPSLALCTLLYLIGT
ncbi:DUF5316 family protein [Paenibacillus tengchongensis]|uniref:DUF5316 family protein n=1 Tax=Paenibacillus tengchongensis TaxID=2608684 RepID=UPI0016528857